jgi:hypothetical protein
MAKREIKIVKGKVGLSSIAPRGVSLFSENGTIIWDHDNEYWLIKASDVRKRYGTNAVLHEDAVIYVVRDEEMLRKVFEGKAKPRKKIKAPFLGDVDYKKLYLDRGAKRAFVIP